MASKSSVVAGMQFGSEFLSNVCKGVLRRGGTHEQVFEAMKTESGLAEEFAELIVVKTKPILKSLNLIARNIVVNARAFTKASFFEKGPAKLWFGESFRNWILPAIPDEIPEFQGNLAKHELMKSMNDSEILAELGSPQPFTIPEFVAIVKSLVEKQPQGEAGTLLSNGYANIFYVQLEDGRVVAAGVYWVSGCREWDLGAYGLGGGGWSGGDCVFSRN